MYLAKALVCYSDVFLKMNVWTMNLKFLLDNLLVFWKTVGSLRKIFSIKIQIH